MIIRNMRGAIHPSAVAAVRIGFGIRRALRWRGRDTALIRTRTTIPRLNRALFLPTLLFVGAAGLPGVLAPLGALRDRRKYYENAQDHRDNHVFLHHFPI